ncbi:hypothetical protein [Paracidobacterium acidisoli]|uniref:Uncharacterized protein n=1 Tax=Paracidobacterium acidisoli TaxID=2303751 RepID=A0A372INV8_9BACT|nr:hypothetical protein [Paracidobacterium acidisoli]MBT9330939.1 hypothetical protein [Paracidobacterium acidisoli]
MERDQPENISEEKDYLQAYIGELETKQSNILWEDAHRNNRGVDKLLWKGDENAPLVQRIGIAVFGFMFLLCGLGLATIGYDQHAPFIYLIAAFSGFIAVRLFFNAVRGLRKSKDR